MRGHGTVKEHGSAVLHRGTSTKEQMGIGKEMIPRSSKPRDSSQCINLEYAFIG